MPRPLVISYILAALAVLVVLYFHLLPAVLAGLAVYGLTVKLAKWLPNRWGRKARGVSLVAIILIVALLVAGIFLGMWSFFQGQASMGALMSTAAQTLDNLRQNLPPYLSNWVPSTVDDLRAQVATLLREHGRNISHVGAVGARAVVHVLFGMIIGGIAVLHRFRETDNAPPLAAAMHDRLRTLADAFDKVVFAQLKISCLNTILTAIYLAAILPLCGVHLPMTTLLILLTFVVGLLPIIGNVISNSVIVLISFGQSVSVGFASIAFLLVIHKLEYFTNARIVGGEVKASSWELLSAMLVMEAIFGIAGLVAAPIIYAWLKSELQAKALV